MLNRLHRGELCPIHKSFYCCGRPRPKMPVTKRNYGPVVIVQDPQHPRGYRELCTLAEKRRRKHWLMSQGKFDCIHCGKDVRFSPDGEKESEYPDIELCHRESQGMNGSKRDDHISNLGLGHTVCNRENGSKRVA